MKKKLILFTFIITAFIACFDKVTAANINWYGVKIECIYTDGGAYSSINKKDEDQIKYVVKIDKNGKELRRWESDLYGLDIWSLEKKCQKELNLKAGETCITKTEITYNATYDTVRTSYNLLGAALQENNAGTMEYVNDAFDTSTHSCRKYLRRGYVTDDDDDSKQATTFYKFGNISAKTQFEENDFEDIGWWSDIWGAKDADEKLEEIKGNHKRFELVSERYILTEDAGEPDFTLTYIQESDQPTGNSNFAYIMFYGNTMLLKTANKTTILNNAEAVKHFANVAVNSSGKVNGLNNNDVIYLNNPEAKATTDSSSLTAYYYEEGQIVYTATTSKTQTNTRKYVLFNVGLGRSNVPQDELCDDIMPQTSKILKEIIKYAQLLVPVFMIILVGFDIGKIVIAGNLDEELPKQKKKIFARLIVGAVFFFLPLVTMLVINLIYDSGATDASAIKQIKCLFE